MKIFFILTYYTERILSMIHTNIIKLGKGIKIGKNSVVYYRSHCYNYSKNGYISIGENCNIGRTKHGYHTGMPFYTTIMNDGESSCLIIGNNCRINGAYIHSKKKIEIGDNCVMAANVNIMDSNAHEVVSGNRTVGRDIPQEIIIGNNVWIGTNCTILKGSIIGDNCVIGAGCVVKGSIPTNHIVTQSNSTINQIRSIKAEEECLRS